MHGSVDDEKEVGREAGWPAATGVTAAVVAVAGGRRAVFVVVCSSLLEGGGGEETRSKGEVLLLLEVRSRGRVVGLICAQLKERESRMEIAEER